ncbi:MAG TPA: phytanoyl-CoA dioxygenase family protein [Polyangiaceae bacterium]|nr:phytanoyl-CoA dioxygenase family protein [Polyangiaceae bacterium]
MLLSPTPEIDPATLSHFAEHGYARLGHVMTDEGQSALRARADELMLGKVVHEGLFFQLDTTNGSYRDLVFGRGYEGPSLNYRKIEKLEKDPLFLEWIRNPLFERVSRALIGGPIVLYRAVLMNKASTGGTVLPWHQDGGLFWGLDRDPMLQIWTALDDAPEDAGCLEILPQSHRDGLATPLGGVVPDEHVAKRRAEERAVALPARAGEAILLHNHVWHRSLVNRTGHPRRALSFCYMSAATRCTRKKRAPRKFFPVWP